MASQLQAQDVLSLLSDERQQNSGLKNLATQLPGWRAGALLSASMLSASGACLQHGCSSAATSRRGFASKWQKQRAVHEVAPAALCVRLAATWHTCCTFAWDRPLTCERRSLKIWACMHISSTQGEALPGSWASSHFCPAMCSRAGKTGRFRRAPLLRIESHTSSAKQEQQSPLKISWAKSGKLKQVLSYINIGIPFRKM